MKETDSPDRLTAIMYVVLSQTSPRCISSITRAKVITIATSVEDANEQIQAIVRKEATPELTERVEQFGEARSEGYELYRHDGSQLAVWFEPVEEQDEGQKWSSSSGIV